MEGKSPIDEHAPRSPLEDQYAELFPEDPEVDSGEKFIDETFSLEQPPPYPYVNTFTTYGAN